jgi:hypothetical protein
MSVLSTETGTKGAASRSSMAQASSARLTHAHEFGRRSGDASWWFEEEGVSEKSSDSVIEFDCSGSVADPEQRLGRTNEDDDFG